MRLISKIIGNQEKPVSNSGENVALTSNPNLLINPWFTVNQRGFTSGTPAVNSFVADRWKVKGNGDGYMSATVNSSGLSFTNGGVIRQYFESNPAAGKTLTLSVLKQDGTIVSATGTSPTTTPIGNDNFITVNFTGVSVIRFCYRDSMFCIMIDEAGADTVAIRAIKLEIGSTSTLHLDTAPDYTTELLKCQRYFVRKKLSGTYFFALTTAVNTGATQGNLNLSTPMRTTPTLTFYGSLFLSKGQFDSHNVSAFSVLGMLDNSLSIHVSSTELTANTPYLLGGASGEYIDLDAEL